MSFRRLVLTVVIVALVAAAALAGWWRYGATRAQAQVQAWAEARRAEGWSVAWDGLAVDGFPWTLRLNFTQPRLTRADGVRWAAPTLTLWSRALWPQSIHAETTGEQSLGLGAWSGTVTVGRAALRWRHQHWDADVHQLRAGGLSIADLAATLMPATRTAPSPADPQLPPSWRFALSGRDIVVPTSPLAGLEPRIALAELSGQMRGTLPALPPVAAIARWSKEGGTVELDRVALDWAPMALEADGTAALDPTGQPLVALSTRITGFGPLMDRLVAGGTVSTGTASAVKTMLTLLAKPDSRGQPAVAAPVSVQDGAVFLGPARLARLPAIPWADMIGRQP